MTGDEEDVRGRLRLTLPDHWFADRAPVLDGVLAGLAAAWAGLHALLGVVRRQSRLSTATDEFLDLASRDYFGSRLPRRAGESDISFRHRIRRAMRRETATRAAVTEAAEEAGYALRVFEPARPGDTGAYGGGGLAWGVAGGWGSLSMPLECLVSARAGPMADYDALRAGLAEVLPAGGVAWMRLE